MGFANLAHLYRIRLRSRLGPELLAVLGIAVGVALVFAALVATASLTGSVRELTKGIVGNADYQLASRGPTGFDQRVLARVRAMDGIAATAAIAEARSNLRGHEGISSVLLVGVDPEFAEIGSRLVRRGTFPDRHGSAGLILPAPLADELGVGPGGRVWVETGAGARPVPIVAEFDERGIGSLIESPVALAPLELVQALAGLRGKLSRIFVEADPGREAEIEAMLGEVAAGRLNLTAADEEAAIFEQAVYPVNQSTELFSGLSALVGFLFAFSATLLTVPQRRQLIAALRMAGYGPGTMVQIILLDALVLGTAGALLGLALGDQVAGRLFEAVPGYLTSAFAVGSQRIITPLSVAVAGGAGILAACVAVLVPIRDALSGDPRPASALAVGGRQERLLTLGGVASLILTIVIAIGVPHGALMALGTAVLTLLLLLPAWMRFSAAAFEAACHRLRSPAAIFAALELRAGSARIRTLALSATAAIAAFATVSVGGAQADLQRGLDAVPVGFDAEAAVWIAFRGSTNIFATTPFEVTSVQLAAIERLPGVRAVRRNGGSFLDVGDRRVWVQAPSRAALDPVSAGEIRAGTPALANRRVREGGWVTLSEGLAAELGGVVGGRVELPSPVPTTFRVAALSNNRGWPGGAIILNAADYARAWGDPAPSALGIVVSNGTSAAAVARAVRGVLGPRSPLRTETRAARIQRQRNAAHTGLSRLSQISALVLLASVLALAVSMGGLIWQRRPTFAALKVHGAGEFELWRSLLLESGLLLATGCLIGAAFGLIGQLLLDRALEVLTGFPLLYESAVATALTVFALLTGAALLVIAIPGWLAVRVRVTAR